MAINCYDDYINIARNRNDGNALDATVIRTRSVEGRKLFAWMMTNRMGTYDQILCALEALRDPARKSDGDRFLKEISPRWATRLARLMTIQAIKPDDHLNALTLYRYVYDTFGEGVISQENAKHFFDLTIKNGNILEAKKILNTLNIKDEIRFFCESDLLNPNFNEKNTEKWLTKVNNIFQKNNLSGVNIEYNGDIFNNFQFFDRLSSENHAGISGISLVSIVISAWNPDHSLITSVKSILSQSWKNLEVLIIDDCSPDGHGEILEYCKNLDPRVRILRQSKNQGTYMARNLALHEARGEFITFQDSDDWSHPQRIEKQIEPLLLDSGLMATTSRTVRMTEDLLFSYTGYVNPEVLNTSSLMFRLKEVKETIGFFDSVRKGADSEYLKRIQIVFGERAYRALPEVLAIVRLNATSLSRSDFRPGWHHPARIAYRTLYTQWHKRIVSGDCSPYRSDSVEDRPFPAPTAFAIERRDPAVCTARYDVIVIGDWRKNGGPQNSMLEEIRAFKEHGYSVAVAHMEAFRFMTTKMDLLNSTIQEMIFDGYVDYVPLTDRVETDLVLIRCPPILQFTSAGRLGVHASSAVIVVNQAPHEKDGSDFRYEVHDCVRNARTLFGIDPIWAPQGPLVREIVEPLVPSQLLASQDIVGIISEDEWAVSRQTFERERPVIGRYSRDDVMKFPDSAEVLLQCYPNRPDVQVRMMGGKKACTTLLEGNSFPGNWEILEHGKISPQEFLDKIDFFVHFDHKEIVEAFGRSILEAITSGRVVILPHKFKRVFGEGAVYCEPAEVYGTVMRYWNDRDLYEKQSEKGRRVARERFGGEAFIHTLSTLVPQLRRFHSDQEQEPTQTAMANQTASQALASQGGGLRRKMQNYGFPKIDEYPLRRKYVEKLESISSLSAQIRTIEARLRNRKIK